MDEDQAPQAASAVEGDADDGDDWDQEGGMGLDNVERVCANRHLREFQDSCRVKKRKGTKTVVEAFESTSDLVNEHAFADADP